jgi:NADPH-dependent 2,4-dienoyl-CoA reductase/sulfur reductase-like enzyme/pSer/pThr/pTyr-binding forkhead associated (FHA) protein/Fe-S-cluster-containing dehydrogenase component/CRP-like cAMP-binding protein
MSESTEILIIGNGVAGVSAAMAARRSPALAPGARIVLACPEPEEFYYRAALTNYLLGELSRDELRGLPNGTLKQQGIERINEQATALDPRSRVVEFASGKQIRYARLLIASGAEARVPSADFLQARGAYALRTLADATALVARMPQSRRAVVLGGGILGLEVLEALHQRGIAATLLHRGEQLLDRVIDRTAGEVLRRRIEHDQVSVCLGARFAGLDTANGVVRGVRLEDGSTLPADLVVSCVGAVPATAWLRTSGLPLSAQGAVQVDPQLQVRGFEGVFAAGDVAAVDESGLPCANPAGLWQPARYQGRVAGRNLAETDAARHVVYSPGVLLNSTRTWGLTVDSAGMHPSTPGLERLVASQVDERGTVHKVAVFQEERLVGFVLLGDRREARALATLLDLREGPRIPHELRERLFDPGFDLHSWVAAQSRAAGLARWAQRDDDRITVEAPGSSSRAGVTLSAFGTTELGRPASVDAQRPLRLEIGGVVESLTDGPVWLGDHAQARWASEETLPRLAALRLEPMGLAWMATSTQVVAGIRINGAVLRQPQFLADNDVIEVGRWRALVAAPEAAIARASTSERTGWLIGPVDRFALVAEGTTRIGRLPENDLVLDRSGIGNFHAQVIADHGAWILVDSGSPDGIAVNDRADSDFRPLQHGDRLRLGTETWRFELTDAAASVASGVAGYLCPENGPDAGHALALRLRQGQASIGRGESVQLRLGDPLVSRRHALVRAVGGGLELLDYGSVNGVQVNGQRIDAEKPWRLHDGDEIRMGAHAYRFSRKLPLGRRVTTASKLDTVAGPTVLGGSARAAAAAPVAAPRLSLEPRPNALFPDLAGVELSAPDVLRIGRSREVRVSGKGLLIPAVTVSRQHAEIACSDGRWNLRDLHSREGTLRNGKPVGEAPESLRDGDLLEFGHVAEFDVRLHAAVVPTVAPAGRALSRRSLSPAFWLTAPNALESDLRAMVETEIDACIGCHACMRACPLPDAENVSIAALNQSAAMGRITDPRALRFVQDCTQCQQCVPVCPVNIQRSRIVLWNKLKLDVDAELRPPMQAGAGTATMAETVAMLSRTYAEHPLLGVLGDRDRLELLSLCLYRRLSDGEPLLGEGSYVSTLWLVHEGELDWQLPTDDDIRVNSLRLTHGMSVGLREFVADEICERVACAAGPATMIGLPRALVSQFVRRSPALREALTSKAADWDLFHRVPDLARLDAADRRVLESEAELALAAPGESLRAFGAAEQGAYVLRGFVAELAEAGGETVRAYHRSGARIRLGAKDQPVRYRAKTACEILLLPAQIEARLQPATTGSISLSMAALPSGKRIMAIDVSRCVDCNNCVDACGRRHGHSRLDRHTQGVQIGANHIPSACYHCEDPKCLLCDTGGIIREPTGEIRIVEENCIGCGSCASRCPYDNIKMVSREKPAATGALSSLLQLLHLADPTPMVEAKPGSLLAVKCDLCVGFDDGPACVRACPTGAAQRISLAEIAKGIEGPA